MATSVSGTGTMSSPGLGSGLDVNGIVSKLMALERQPIDLIDNKTTTIQAQLTAYGTLQGSLAAFQTAAQALTNPETFTASTASVGDPTIFTATSSPSAALGSYDIEVVNLAKSEKLQTGAFNNNTDTIGSGSLTIDFGTYTTTSGVTTFAENTSKKSVTVTIPSGSGSIGTIASAINAANAGVNASVINDGTYYYLQFSSLDGGTANSLRINVSDDDGNNLNASGLSLLAFDKSSGNTSGSVPITTRPTVAVAAASANNTFSIALDGGASVDVTVADGTYDGTNIVAAMQSAIDNAVGAGNATVSLNASKQLVITSLGGSPSVALTSTSGNTGLAAIFGDTINGTTATGTSAYTTGGFSITASNNQFDVSVDGGAPVTVTVTPGDYDNTTIVAAVQAALEGPVLLSGLTLVSLNSSNQLVVSSLNTGSLSQVTLSAVTGNAGLASIFGDTTALTTPRQLTEIVAPQDAVLKIDGTTVTKSSNIITDAIQGITLNLLKESTPAVTTAVTISKDTGSLSTKVSGLVTAYNTTESMLANLLAYDPTTGKAGALQGEATVRSIQAQLKSTLQSLISGQSGLTSLSNIGVSFQRDGSLKFDSSKLQTILGDQTINISNFFIGANSDGNGIATKLNNLLNTFLDTGNGNFVTRTGGLTQTLSDYAKQKTALESRMADVEARYRKQFTNLDTLIASMNSTQQYLTQQLANLPTIGGTTNR